MSFSIAIDKDGHIYYPVNDGSQGIYMEGKNF